MRRIRLSFPVTDRQSKNHDGIGKKGALKVVKLPISVPCHCNLLDQAAEWLRADLNGITFHEFQIPVIPNCDSGLFYNRENVRELLTRQITSPVQWQGTIEKMSEIGVDTIIEIGPKRTLSGLIKRIDRKMRLMNVEDRASLGKTAAFFRCLSSVSRLSWEK